MDVITAVSNYVTNMVGVEGSGNSHMRMKMLLLDNETVSIVSTAVTQSKLLSHDVYLIDRLENTDRENMRHLKCLCFVRPSARAIQLLIDELNAPKYGEYYIYFSNIVKKSALERLAEADRHEVVRAVQEHFADYLALNSDLFSIPPGSSNSNLLSAPNTWQDTLLTRTTEGVMAVLLSLKKKPLIRYEMNSIVTKQLASEISYRIKNEEQIFNFGRTVDTPPILIILDRRNDLITPLLSQWTYQAMVHELLGIVNGKVDLSHVPDIRSELKEIVLSQAQDPFFKRNMYLNFGDLGRSIKDHVDQYQTKTKSNMNIESIADMKRFVEEYPEFRKLSGSVSKHVTLVGELSRRVENDRLLELSELEQSLACNDSHSADLKAIQQMLQSHQIPACNKVRLVAIYCIRYHHHRQNSSAMLFDLLSINGVQNDQIITLKNLLVYSGSLQRAEDSFNVESIFSRARSGFKGLQGIENVYTQHSPRLEQTLNALINGTLPTTIYPCFEGSEKIKAKPQDIIIFMVGGVTYGEAKVIGQVNSSTKNARVVLGGTSTLNCSSFLNDIDNLVQSWPHA